MKNNIILYLLSIGLISILPSCELTVEPFNGKSTETILSTAEGVEAATLGNYSNLKGNDYAKNLHILTEYPER